MSDDKEGAATRLAVSEEPVHAAWTPDGESKPRLSERAVIDAISKVYDPEIPVNIYDLGLVYVIDISDEGRVHIEMTLTSPGCPSAQELPVEVHDVLMGVEGVTDVEVQTVWDPPWDPSRMSEEAKLQLDMY